MKSNKTKSAMTALVIAAMICTAAMPVKAEESKWVNNGGNWSLIKADGSKATGWVKDGECWYAFDENGSMRTGWVASHEHWYFMGKSGVMQVNTMVEDNGATYFVKSTGVMAKDYVKDGYEFTSDGKAIPLSESKSVVLTDASELEGKVIEGNLYVDITTAKEIELKGVTVKGKLVIVGDNETAGKVTLTDSTIDTVSTQTRNAEFVLGKDANVDKFSMEELAEVKSTKDYNGKIGTIEIQSTTKGKIVIEVPTENVSTNSYAPVEIKAPVENLEIKTETAIKVDADVKNLTVTETATDTKLEVKKGSTIGTVTADAPVKIDGEGTVEKVEANVDGVEASKDTTIKKVETGDGVKEAPDATKPDKGSSTGGSDDGGSTPTVDPTVAKVSSEKAFTDALDNPEIKTIELAGDFKIENKIIIERPVMIDGKGHTIGYANKPTGWVKNGNNYVLQFYNVGTENDKVVLKNINIEETLAGVSVNGSHVKLDNVTIDAVIGGVELGNGIGNTDRTYSLEVSKLNYVNESMLRASIWIDAKVTNVDFNGYTREYINIGETVKTQFYKSEANLAKAIITSEEELRQALSLKGITTIELMNDIEITDKVNVERNVDIDGKGHTIGYKNKPAGWKDDGNNYVLQFYNVGTAADKVVLKNINIKDTLAGLFVNGSHVKLGNVKIDADLGGVELGYGPKNTNHVYSLEVSELNYVNEAYGKPSIWVDSADSTQESIGGYTKITYTKKDGSLQVHYYKNIVNSLDKDEIVIRENEFGEHDILFAPFNEEAVKYEIELQNTTENYQVATMFSSDLLNNGHFSESIESIVSQLHTQEEITETYDTLNIYALDEAGKRMGSKISKSINVEVNISKVQDSFTVTEDAENYIFNLNSLQSISNSAVCIDIECTCESQENHDIVGYGQYFDEWDEETTSCEIEKGMFIGHESVRFFVGFVEDAVLSEGTYIVNVKQLTQASN